MKYWLLIPAILCCSFPAAADDVAADFATVYSTIATEHINPVEVEKVAISGLRGLKQVDGNLTFADGSNNVLLYYRGKQIGLWRKPKNVNDAKGWGKIAAAAVTQALKISPQAREHDNVIEETVLNASAQSLNDNSRYYMENRTSEHGDNNAFAYRRFGNALYFKIGSFDKDTATKLAGQLQNQAADTPVIIDLRGNQGGLIGEAIEVARLFIDGGIIVSVKGKKTKYYTAADLNEDSSRRLAVLIDEQTASSAEMLAAALQEQAQALLIGTRSFGKGSVQELYHFDNGGRLALTTAYFFTPSGQSLDKQGLKPDYCTAGAPADLSEPATKDYKTADCERESRIGNTTDINLALQLLQELD